MKVLLLIVSLFFLSHFSISQVGYGDNTTKKRMVAVVLDSQGNYFIDSKKVDSIHFDSSLLNALRKLPPQIRLDSAVVVINADSDVSVTKVYHVMQITKRGKAKVVVNIKMD